MWVKCRKTPRLLLNLWLNCGYFICMATSLCNGQPSAHLFRTCNCINLRIMTSGMAFVQLKMLSHKAAPVALGHLWVNCVVGKVKKSCWN